MLSFFLKSKLHRVRVTEARLDYMGSMTLDPDFLDATGALVPGSMIWLF